MTERTPWTVENTQSNLERRRLLPNAPEWRFTIMEGVTPIATLFDSASDANAKRVVLAVNAHDELVDGVRLLLTLNREKGSPLGDYGAISDLAKLVGLDEFVAELPS